jgi:hypothetical protein
MSDHLARQREEAVQARARRERAKELVDSSA